MRREDGKIIFSPHDLMNFMASRFVTWMDRRKLDDKTLEPDAVDASAKILQSRGIQHEQRHLGNLQQTAKRIIEIPDDRKNGLQATIDAMRAGYDEIYQAQLQHDQFGGIADFLTKVPGSSKLGDWHYEVWDTKLAKKISPEFVMQLCCYAEMLEQIQGVLPEKIGIILGDNTESPVRTQDHYFFYKRLKASLLEYVDSFDPNVPPDEIVVPAICRWASHADKLLRERDDLSLVASIRRAQIKKLHEAGISTVQQLADYCSDSIKNMRAETFLALREQARLQVKSRLDGKHHYDLLPPEEGRRGFKLLPPEHELDVFFDMEGYALSEPPLEYLFGATYLEGDNAAFWYRWAHDERQERAAFENFIDWAFGRWQQSGHRMHIYHYASYEVTAMKKLMQRYGTREQQVDDLLRNNVFVDLFTVVRQSMRVGEESYSIKYIEKFYGIQRGENVANAVDSIVAYDRFLNTEDEQAREQVLQEILAYNKVDCDSTYHLVLWLRERQLEKGIAYQPPKDCEDNNSDKGGSARGGAKADCANLAQSMLADSPSIADDHARKRYELLAYLLQFHEREDKPFWWEVFACAALNHDELVEHPECLGWVKFSAALPKKTSRHNPRFEYKFEPQETSVSSGASCMFTHDLSRCKVEEFDAERGTLLISRKQAPPEVIGLIPAQVIPKEKLQEALCQIVSAFVRDGRLPEAIEHFLDRAEPRIKGKIRGAAIFDDSGDPIEQACELVVNMDRTTLCVQGPPGCGKTFAASEMICRLMQQGKKVAITSNSHPAIENLMRAVSSRARSKKQQFVGVKAGGEFTDYCVTPMEDITGLLASGEFDLIGGTAWKFCTADAVDKFDYLFVDEAGQVCIANLVAMSRCAKNIVLLGDQMQLEQPCQGVHPGESGMSILEYYLRDHATIPNELGVFLPHTWRMHADLCSLISSAVYEGRLDARPEIAKRTLKLPSTPLELLGAPAGILYVPVEHEGNTQTSDEEVACVRRIIDELLHCSITDEHGNTRRFSIADVLVVAPYNLQVRALRNGLQAGVKVGTVDKFQGQEAAVSILSMAASDANASPRGLSFLFDKHRLNVALSRAQILSIVVGNPALANAHCSNVGNMALVNFYCRIIEHGSCRPLATSLS